ncbi:MAG: hypothetical protein EBU90_16715 [Proteobacteria bacterium]|nr:hypothetical protein [Pseudomonadota bacterium]NBP15769.1 hypothetical protein [bacterium]
MPKNMYIFFALSLLVSSNALQSTSLAEDALKIADTAHTAADKGTDSAQESQKAGAEDLVIEKTEATNTQTVEKAVVQTEEEVVTTPVATTAQNNSAATNAELADLFTDEDEDDSDDEL